MAEVELLVLVWVLSILVLMACPRKGVAATCEVLALDRATVSQRVQAVGLLLSAQWLDCAHAVLINGGKFEFTSLSWILNVVLGDGSALVPIVVEHAAASRATVTIALGSCQMGSKVVSVFHLRNVHNDVTFKSLNLVNRHR